MYKSMIVALILVFLTTSCASYSPQSVEKPLARSMSYSIEESGLLVSVDPYTDAKKSKKLFDADLKKAGILALRVMVNNQTDQGVLIRKTGFFLRLPGDKEFIPAPATSAAGSLERSGGVIGWTIAFGLIGMLVAASQQEKADSARRADFRTKEFQDATLARNESANGFLFFRIPADIQKIENADLVVKAVNVKTADRTTVVVPLGNLGVWPAKKKELPPDEGTPEQETPVY